MLSDASLTAGSRLPAQRSHSSRDLGWSDVLASTYLEPAEAEPFTTAETPDLLLVLQLTGTNRVETRRGGRWIGARYAPGSMGATAPGVSTELRLRPGGGSADITRTLHLHLAGGLLARTADDLGRPGAVRHLPDGLVLEDPAVRATARAVGAALTGRADPLGGDALAQALAVQVLALVDAPRGAADAGTVRPLGAADLRRVDEHMRVHLAGPVRLDDLAGLVHTSRYHFVRRFRAATGTTPHRELVRLRVEHAGLLLRTTALDVRAVATACGYTSAAHFTDAFARHHGVTPGAFRVARRR